MHDGMEKSQSAFSRKQFIMVCALAGLLLLGGVLGASAHSDLKNAEKQFEDTISYVKEQCTGYDNLNLASETKSLMRMMENAQHLCSEIARDQQENPKRALDDAAMEEYLQDYTLSGILVLSAEGKILCGASQDGRAADPQVRTQMEKELAEAGYEPDTPAAIIYKATWPEEKIVRCTVSTLARSAEENGIKKTAMIFIGDVFGTREANGYEESRLYAPDFSTEFRKGTDA